MNYFLKLLLSLTVSGSVLILILMLLKKPVLRKINYKWQYYIWLIIIARLLIPFSPDLNLINQGMQIFEETEENILPSKDVSPALLDDQINTNLIQVINEANVTSSQSSESQISSSSIDWETLVITVIMLLWLTVAVLLLINKIRVYRSFQKYIRLNSTEVADLKSLEILGTVMEQMNIDRHIGLYFNSNVSSPMLVGFIRSNIVLPDVNISEDNMRLTLMHELTHYKRKDMFYKWLVQFILCIHWFNPFVYWMGRSISQSCELACDEAVVTNLSEYDRHRYGDMLLDAARPVTGIHKTLAAVTLVSNAQLLKERLISIMNIKKKTIFTRYAAVIITIVLCIGSFLLGTYHTSASNEENETQEVIKTESETDNETVSASDISNNEEVDIYDEYSGSNYSTCSGYYMDSYVFFLEWRNTKTYHTSLKLGTDKTTVYFTDDNKDGASNVEVTAALEKIILKEKSDHGRNSLITKGYVVVQEYKYVGTEFADTAKEAYDNATPWMFQAVLPYLESADLNEILEMAYEDERIEIFTIGIAYADEEVIKEFEQKATNDHKVAFMAVLGVF